MKIITKKKRDSYSIHLSVKEDKKIIAWAYVYILKNDLHDEPFGFLENVFVEEGHRSRGIGSELVKAAIEAAKKEGCYKLIGTSRTEKESVHRFYERLGFKKHGFEFRVDLKPGKANLC